MKRVLVLLLALTLAACGGGGRDEPSKRGGMVAESIGAWPGPGGCGVKDAYRVSRAGGVALSPSAILSKRAMNRLDRWVRDHAVPIVGKRGGGLLAVRVAAHYACRSRNSQKGARLSEHAKGNAIDISEFILADGSRISVLEGWNGKDGQVLRRLHKSACGPFGTVLGPNSDRFHRDHFHFDVAEYRSGTYCR
jgi:hypothetical protein